MSIATDPASPPLPFSGVCWGLAAAFIWGAWPVVSRLGVADTAGTGESFSAFDITMIRFSVAGAALLPVLVFTLSKQGISRFMRSVPPPAILFMAVGAGVPYVFAAVTGLSMAPATHAGIIIPSCMLCFTTIGGALFLNDRPGVGRLLGIACVLIGVATTGASARNEAAISVDLLLGDALFILSGFFWAIYTVSCRRWGIAPLLATAIVSVASLLVIAPVYVLKTDWPDFDMMPWDQIALQAFGQGIAAGILALVFYSKAVALLGAGRGALFAALVPGTACALAYPILGEAPTATELIGLAAATTGMLVALKAR